jgi:ketosteroid isomerase-like protein/uncharacterized glyoxalase superfamily protein PhnB
MLPRMTLPRAIPMIHVPDVRGTARWYEGIGFTLTGLHEEPDGEATWAELTIGHSTIMLNAGGKPSAAARREVDLYVMVDRLEPHFLRVREHAELVEGVHGTDYGMREFIVRDCNGFWLTFGEVMADATADAVSPPATGSETGPVTVAQLKSFLEAFNRHDLDAIMEHFADECVFYMPRGEGPRGDRFVGKVAVRAGLAQRFAGIPDVHYGEDVHWACGEFGVSEWTLTGTSVTGEAIRVRGVDLLEFSGGRIMRKDAFWKSVAQPAAPAPDTKP